MKKACFVILCALIALPSFANTSATLREIKGKVEVKPLGKAWVEAKEGMTVDLLATISTGFNSSATLMIADNKIVVAPLTRLTVDKIVEQAGTLGTSLHLRVGKVNAEVKSSTSTPQDFKVTSPYSTASVRGTIFEYDGFVLDVQDGVVTFIPGRPARNFTPPAIRTRSAPADGEVEEEETGEETVSPEEYNLADFMADLAAEFPDDTFEEPVTTDQTPAPPASGVAVTGGGSLVMQLDLSTPAPGQGQPGGSITTGQSGTLGAGGTTPVTGETTTGPVVKPPTTGRIVITITQPTN